MVYFLAGLAAAVATAFLTVKKDALTVPAALEAMVLILVSCWFGKWFGLAYLLIAYFSIALIDRVLKKKTAGIFSGINKKHGARDHIQVAANDHNLFFVQLMQIIAEGIIPLQTVVDSGQLPLGIGGVAGDEEKAFVFQCNQTPFRIQFRYTDTVADR